MNVYQAANDTLPFTRPSIIGAYLVRNGYMVHRDCVEDFSDLDFIDNEVIAEVINPNDQSPLTTEDIMANDWTFVYL